MSEIPEWLRPYCKQGAYTPTKVDIVKLEPQSRKEVLLKYFKHYRQAIFHQLLFILFPRIVNRQMFTKNTST